MDENWGLHVLLPGGKLLYWNNLTFTKALIIERTECNSEVTLELCFGWIIYISMIAPANALC